MTWNGVVQVQPTTERHFSAVGAREKLVELHAVFEARKRAEADQFRLFAEFADQYRYVPDESPVLSGTERLMYWGGDGTPGVAEFCTLEVAAALRMSEESVRAHIAQSLAIRHRFPTVWARVMDGRTRVWQAWDIASETRDLPYFHALDLDLEIAPLLDSMSPRRLLELVKARVLDILRDDAEELHDHHLGRRRVDFHHSNGTGMGVADLSATVDAVDAEVLDRQLTRLAIILRQGGSTESLDVRRAQALGLLANPARALQLIQASLTDQLPDSVAACPAAGAPDHACGMVTVDPDRLLPKAEIVVHISQTVLQDQAGVVRTEKWGPMLAGWAKDLLAHTRVTVRPVLHPDNLVASDAYECAHWMREWVQLRNPYEVFPWSTKRSGRLDLDHTIPWAPPEPDAKPLTRPDNLGPLSRKVHRAKTHGGWGLTQVRAGTFLWQSPLGFGYLVTPSHSWMIEDPSGQILLKAQQPDQDALAC